MTTRISDAIFNLKEFWGVKYLYFLSSFPSLFWIEKINAILTEFVVGDRGHATVMCLMGLMTDNATNHKLNPLDDQHYNSEDRKSSARLACFVVKNMSFIRRIFTKVCNLPNFPKKSVKNSTKLRSRKITRTTKRFCLT